VQHAASALDPRLGAGERQALARRDLPLGKAFDLGQGQGLPVPRLQRGQERRETAGQLLFCRLVGLQRLARHLFRFWNGDNAQWIWVSFIKNWQTVADTPQGGTLPDLDLATPIDLDIVNHYFKGNPAGNEIKAYAVCEEPDPVQPVDLGNRWRYRFTLYLAVGPASPRAMWRAHRVFVVVDKASQEITSYGMSGDFQEVIPLTYRPVAHYIFTDTACAQLQQSPPPYDNLSSSKFAWKDQYTSSFTYQKTSRTNYHTILERTSDGKTALVFEQCVGQTACDTLQFGNRDCECDGQNDYLSTTGFAAGGQPTPITNWSSGPLNVVGGRVSHPAISGPQNTTGDSWLLFFMKGKKIWYTKVKE